jgi:hypothetical protein
MIGQYVAVHGEVISHVNISRAHVEDGGLYTCIAENRAGRAEHSARLNIYGRQGGFTKGEMTSSLLNIYCIAFVHPWS